MTSAIEKVLTDDRFRQRLIDHGKIHCRKFTWEAVATAALTALEHKFGAENNGMQPVLDKTTMVADHYETRILAKLHREEHSRE